MSPAAGEPLPRLWTTEEVADRFRTAPGTVRYWRMVGYGPRGVKIGRRVLYDAAEVEAWYRQQASGQA